MHGAHKEAAFKRLNPQKNYYLHSL